MISGGGSEVRIPGIRPITITAQFRKRGRTLDDEALTTLLATADLIPYDVQRIAHELWDYAELKDKRTLWAEDVKTVINKLVIGQSTYYELLWERLPARQRATLQALAHRRAAEIYSQAVREEFRLGPASSVQKALQSLDSHDILDRYRGEYFFGFGLKQRSFAYACWRYATWHNELFAVMCAFPF